MCYIFNNDPEKTRVLSYYQFFSLQAFGGSYGKNVYGWMKRAKVDDGGVRARFAKGRLSALNVEE